MKLLISYLIEEYKVIYIDEFSMKTNIIANYGYSKIG